MPRKLKTVDVAPETVTDGRRRGKIRMAKPKVRDAMVIDPEEEGGYYDDQLFNLYKGYRPA